LVLDETWGYRKLDLVGPLRGAKWIRLACQALLDNAPQDEKSGDRGADHHNESNLTHEYVPARQRFQCTRRWSGGSRLLKPHLRSLYSILRLWRIGLLGLRAGLGEELLLTLLGFSSSIGFGLGAALLLAAFLSLPYLLCLGSRDTALRLFQCLAEFGLRATLLLHLLGNRLR